MCRAENGCFRPEIREGLSGEERRSGRTLPGRGEGQGLGRRWVSWRVKGNSEEAGVAGVATALAQGWELRESYGGAAPSSASQALMFVRWHVLANPRYWRLYQGKHEVHQQWIRKCCVQVPLAVSPKT